ncbi:MAG: rhodanese-like domain-containing protein [Candidatus Omnitrophota bacterium]
MTLLAVKKPNAKRAAEFFESKCEFTTGPVEVSCMIQERHPDLSVIDVREHKDYAQGHIPGAINLPRDQWDRCEGLSKDKTQILYCYSQNCHLAAKGAEYFSRLGFPVMEMEGGFEAWQEKGLPVEK